VNLFHHNSFRLRTNSRAVRLSEAIVARKQARKSQMLRRWWSYRSFGEVRLLRFTTKVSFFLFLASFPKERVIFLAFDTLVGAEFTHRPRWGTSSGLGQIRCRSVNFWSLHCWEAKVILRKCYKRLCLWHQRLGWIHFLDMNIKFLIYGPLFINSGLREILRVKGAFWAKIAFRRLISDHK